MNPAPEPAANEIVTTRTFDAPRALVFEAWTRPEHVDRWWGPDGFETVTEHMDVHPGGEWRYTMRHPRYGTYPNRVVYREVVPPERLVLDHDSGSGDEADPHAFRLVVWFEERSGQTVVTMRHVFPSAEKRAQAKRFGAVEGARQTLEHLAAWVAKRARARVEIVVDPDSPAVVVRRTFDAPVHRVFVACTTPEHVARWWGPRALRLVVCEIDLRPGGHWRYVARAEDGTEYGFGGEYLEVVFGERVVSTWRFDGAEGEAIETVTFEQEDGRTVLTSTLVHPTFEARDAHVEAGMERGATESMDRLAELLASPPSTEPIA